MPGSRRSLRLQDYDYASAGAYFITICVQNRNCLFGEIIEEEMRVNPAGAMIVDVWENLSSYPGVEVDAFVVMPNHVHEVVVLREQETGRITGPVRACGREDKHGGVVPTEGAASGDRLSLPGVVQRFKSFTTARYRHGVREERWPPFPGTLWQRNYCEHVIRNEEELNWVREYILTNALNWHLDRENPDRA